MKNSTKLFGAMALAVLTLATACSEKQEPMAPEEEGTITLTASIENGASTRVDFDDQDTKGIKLTWSEAETFSLYRSVNGSLSGPSKFEKMGTDAGLSSATFQGNIPIGKGNSFIAYYPAIPEGTSTPDSRDVTGQIQESNNSTNHLTSYLFMKAITDDLKGGLKFKHQMALLTFDLTKPDEFISEEKVTSLTLSASTVEDEEAKVFFTTTDNSSNVDKTSSLDLKFGDATFDAAGRLKAYMLVTGGAELQKGILLTFTLYTNKNTYTYTQKILSDITYKAGRRYTGTIRTWLAEKGSKNDGELEDIKDAGSMFGYEGTIENPIEISDVDGFDELFEINDMTDSEYNSIDWTKRNYKLTQDIVLSSPVIEGTSNWIPIGTKERPFKGTFDGNGHTISNLVIYIPNTENADPSGGFFGKLDGATIKGLNIEGDIANYHEQGLINGGIAARITNSVILGCNFKGYIYADITYEYLGGIVGVVEASAEGSSVITGCLHYGTIEGKNKGNDLGMGGIIGKQEDCYMYGCSNHGGHIVYENAIIGNLVGVRSKDNTGINHCRYVIVSLLEDMRHLSVGLGDTPTDGSDTAVESLNTEDVVNALNKGIKDYNETVTDPYNRCNYHYEVAASGDLPVIKQDVVVE